MSCAICVEIFGHCPRCVMKARVRRLMNDHGAAVEPEWIADQMDSRCVPQIRMLMNEIDGGARRSPIKPKTTGERLPVPVS